MEQQCNRITTSTRFNRDSKLLRKPTVECMRAQEAPMLEQGGKTHFWPELNGNSLECTKQQCDRITKSRRFETDSKLRCKPTLESRRAMEAPHAGPRRGNTFFAITH
jgi:hypothetical protein